MDSDGPKLPTPLVGPKLLIDNGDDEDGNEEPLGTFVDGLLDNPNTVGANDAG